LFATGGLAAAVQSEENQAGDEQQPQQADDQQTVVDPFERLRQVFRPNQASQSDASDDGRPENDGDVEEQDITVSRTQLEEYIQQRINETLSQAGMQHVFQAQAQQQLAAQQTAQQNQPDPLAVYNERISQLQALATQNERARYEAMQLDDQDSLQSLTKEHMKIQEEIMVTLGHRTQAEAFESQRALDSHFAEMRSSFTDGLRADFSIPATPQDFDAFFRHYGIEHLMSPQHAQIFRNQAIRNILGDAAKYRFLVDGLNRTAAQPAPGPARFAVQTQGAKPVAPQRASEMPAVTIDFLVQGSKGGKK
jgi:hypothetical protein